MKIKFLAIAIVAFIFSGCYTSTAVKSDETYGQSHYDVDIYIDYDFSCSYCYYEMYWCFNCQTYHVHVNHWCHNHYYWYTSWYSVHYYHPYSYYHGHYNNHVYYRDATRHYIRDNSGLRNIRGGSINNTTKIRENTNSDISRKYDIRLKEKYDNTYKNRQDTKTYQRQNNTSRDNKTYQKQNNTQRQNTQSPTVKTNSGSKTMKKR